MTEVGMVKSTKGRVGMTALFDHLLGMLKEKHETIRIAYGRENEVSPFYTASFIKDYANLPAVTMTIGANKQVEVGIGQMAGGPAQGIQSGMHNFTQVQFDVWGRNRLETEAIADTVLQTFQKNKRELLVKGILDVKLSRTYDRPYDPNAPRMWFGSTQAPGEIWMKMLEYTVRWNYVWSPEYEVYDIKKIELYHQIDDETLYDDLGLLILGTLDSMYLTRFLGRGIKTLRTGGRY